MRKTIVNTKVSVKLRKSEYAEEWYLYIEAYPVFVAGKDKPQRQREYLNRSITHLSGTNHAPHAQRRHPRPTNQKEMPTE